MRERTRGLRPYDRRRRAPDPPRHRRAWSLDDQSAPIAYGLGLALKELGRDDEALARFLEATRLRPVHVEAHLQAGNLQRAARDDDAAMASYAQVHRIDPRREDGYYLHGLAQLAAADTTGAITTWRRGLRAAPSSARLHLATATGLVMAGRAVEARALAARAQELGTDPVNGDLVAALIHDRLGQAEAARHRYGLAKNRLREPSPDPTLRALLVQLARSRMRG